LRWASLGQRGWLSLADRPRPEPIHQEPAENDAAVAARSKRLFLCVEPQKKRCEECRREGGGEDQRHDDEEEEEAAVAVSVAPRRTLDYRGEELSSRGMRRKMRR